ncbi:STAS domain-containing protein [Lysobacter soli]|uniref:STAS domain-containing protein n=1 Tax=Lysobacter soli TaxID=453783 RepID=A0A3D8VDE0_9GAMM|nr:STAS domain-containing protein [Lysobacter soli]QGW65025.1 STAS domain-containing protein [Lysobacter soli]RDY67413.1 STAS domain-containing protein [Lysobacter soli]
MNLHELFLTEKDAIRSGWIQELQRVSGNLAGRVSQADLMKRADEMSGLLVQALQSSGGNTVDTVDFTILDRFFDEFARDRVEQGFNSEETATFVFTLKRPLFERIQARTAGDAQAMAQLSWDATELVDRLGLRAVSAFQRMREAVIERQQHELLELSTPVVKLWKDVLALPIIGTLDSNRTQIMMETLLTRIAETEAAIAIIDITGVPTVDTLVAQHLIKTVTAIRLMGADCIISGVRPQIAQTIVHLGVDLGEVTTKANLADALALALKRTGVRVVSGGEAA